MKIRYVLLNIIVLLSILTSGCSDPDVKDYLDKYPWVTVKFDGLKDRWGQSRLITYYGPTPANSLWTGSGGLNGVTKLPEGYELLFVLGENNENSILSKQGAKLSFDFRGVKKGTEFYGSNKFSFADSRQFIGSEEVYQKLENGRFLRFVNPVGSPNFSSVRSPGMVLWEGTYYFLKYHIDTPYSKGKEMSGLYLHDDSELKYIGTTKFIALDPRIKTYFREFYGENIIGVVSGHIEDGQEVRLYEKSGEPGNLYIRMKLTPPEYGPLHNTKTPDREWMYVCLGVGDPEYDGWKSGEPMHNCEAREIPTTDNLPPFISADYRGFRIDFLAKDPTKFVRSISADFQPKTALGENFKTVVKLDEAAADGSIETNIKNLKGAEILAGGSADLQRFYLKTAEDYYHPLGTTKEFSEYYVKLFHKWIMLPSSLEFVDDEGFEKAGFKECGVIKYFDPHPNSDPKNQSSNFLREGTKIYQSEIDENLFCVEYQVPDKLTSRLMWYGYFSGFDGRIKLSENHVPIVYKDINLKKLSERKSGKLYLILRMY